MAASLPSFPSLSIAIAALDASSDTLTTLFILLLFLPLAVSYWWTLVSRRSNHVKAAARHKPGARGTPPPPPAVSIPRGAPAPWRPVIRLHSTTPGQSPNEYNVGDEQGTRGSTLVRAA